LRQGHNIGAAKAKVGAQRAALLIALAFDRNANNPAPCPRRINDQMKPVSIAMPTGPKVLNPSIWLLTGIHGFDGVQDIFAALN